MDNCPSPHSIKRQCDPSMKKAKNVKEARFAIFTKVYADFSLQRSSSSQSSTTLTVLLYHLVNQNYTNRSYGFHTFQTFRETLIPSTYSTIVSTVDNGWQEVDGQYEFRWFEGEQLPTFDNEVVIQPGEGESDVLEVEKSIDDIDDDRYEKDDADNVYCEDNDGDDEEEIDEVEEEFV
ncbi:unnamed protein product [Psylliodes chrysocephalus]|uniref:Uncharacterized protein n=1 Tax=Psylliodes chrysocephalus TaxID=3402493 RepID=A0A9P0CMC0_9CUCU|nr:unnamed protein product [Psylliodes chrysocephala]